MSVFRLVVEPNRGPEDLIVTIYIGRVLGGQIYLFKNEWSELKALLTGTPKTLTDYGSFLEIEE